MMSRCGTAAYANENWALISPLHLRGKEGSRAQGLLDQRRENRPQQETFGRRLGLAGVLQGLFGLYSLQTNISLVPAMYQHLVDKRSWVLWLRNVISSHVVCDRLEK